MCGRRLTGFISPGLESTTAMRSSSHLMASMNSPCTTTPSCIHIAKCYAIPDTLCTQTHTHTHLWFVQQLINLPLLFPHGCIVVFLLVSVLRQRSELEAQLIDGQVVLPGMVLECACEKALWEEES